MKLSKFQKEIQTLQDSIIYLAKQGHEGLYGDGINLVNNDDFKVTNSYSDGIYMRKLEMKRGSIGIGAIHNTDHFWFLLTGRIIVKSNNEEVEHIAPCIESSPKGTQRIIIALEDSIFVNTHKNPLNLDTDEEIEKYIYSFTMEEYNNKNK